MDINIQDNIDELIGRLQKEGATLSDPVSKLMVTTLIYQAQKIKDRIEALPLQVVERLCSYFVPKNKIDAMPALCLVQPSVKKKRGIEAVSLSTGSYFTYKIDNKLFYTYYPIYQTSLLQVTERHQLAETSTATPRGRVNKLTAHHRPGRVWLGLELPGDIDSLHNVSFFIKGSNVILPRHIFIGNDLTELSFSAASNTASMTLMEPFDSQQTSPKTVDIYAEWQKQLAKTPGGRLIYITDRLVDRDVFKLKSFPKVFGQFLEDGEIDQYENNAVWLLFDFGDDIEPMPDLEIIPNVMPVVNVEINTVTLTQSSPIAKLTKGDGSYFLNLVETSLSSQKQGFSRLKDEIIIRDYDADCYNPEVLYHDVRNLYYHFIDDYHAFVNYHDIKDGESIKKLRELVNGLGESVKQINESRDIFDEGVYAMRTMELINNPLPVRVSYLTTNGKAGNIPEAGTVMENKKDVALEKEVKVISPARGGENKASADERYELLRYYTMTSDRLFTRMDIDAFLRMQLLKEFGKDETERIDFDITVQGAAGYSKLVRGLYIDIKFKDTKNYQKAVSQNMGRKFEQMIVDKSCLSMPVFVNLVNLEIR